MIKVSEEINPHQRYRQKIIDAIDRGDSKEAKSTLDEFCKAVQGAHADKLHHLGVALEFILEKQGEDAVAEFWRRSFEDIGLPKVFGQIGQLSGSEGPVKVAEDQVEFGIGQICRAAQHEIDDLERTGIG